MEKYLSIIAIVIGLVAVAVSVLKRKIQVTEYVLDAETASTIEDLKQSISELKEVVQINKK